MIRTSYSINVHHGYVYQGVVRVQRSSLLNLDLDTRMYARRFSWRTGDVLEAQNCNLKKHFNMCCLRQLAFSILCGSLLISICICSYIFTYHVVSLQHSYLFSMIFLL